MSTPALLDCVEIETAPNPSRAVIWIHGLGSDGHDFAPIVPGLDLKGVPATRFVFPHGPVRPITVNNGMKMRAWYDIKVMDLVRQEDAAGIRESQGMIEALIARENARGIPSEHIVLGGFSQGCAMALYTGLRHPRRLAGIVALSGYVVLPADFAAERAAVNAKTPVFLAHGVHDPVVPFARAEHAHTLLQGVGQPVEWHSYQIPHSVSPAELADVAAFLRRTLGGPDVGG